MEEARAEARERLAACQELQRKLEEVTNRWAYLPWDIPQVEIIPDLSIAQEADPFCLDAQLQKARLLAQRVDGYMMKLLRTLSAYHLCSDLQFTSIDHYVTERLGISPRTVEFHRANIMLKLSAKNVADLMRIVFAAK